MTAPIGPGLLPFLTTTSAVAAKPQRMFRSLEIASSGLSAQRVRMEVAATNISNAETTHGADGNPFKRQIVTLQSVAGDGGDTVEVASITEDNTLGPLVYDPGHPDANADGYVRYPNVRITDETVDLMSARRVYEANASVLQVAKAMLRHSLDI
jgi:flagellar basal-body rod protein FlgC